MKLYEIYSGEELKIAEKMQQRRLQMLVHSYIYYALNDNLVSDSKWAEWANELKDLQEKYPKIAKIVPYRQGFENWDASTGAFLPYKNSKIITIANRLLHRTSQSAETPKKSVKRKLF